MPTYEYRTSGVPLRIQRVPIEYAYCIKHTPSDTHKIFEHAY